MGGIFKPEVRERGKQQRFGEAMAWLRSEMATGAENHDKTSQIRPLWIPIKRPISVARRSHFHRRFRGAFSHC
jgi:hypothetical protein